MVRPADPQFGDYQANLALGLAKALRQKPRDIAQAIADRLTAQPGLVRARRDSRVRASST
jgi:arginyl-tRNA synthetase